jgi:hypothetical protein
VRRTYRIVFEDLVKEMREGLDEPARTELASEAGRVQVWLDTEEPRGKGLVVFSCGARGSGRPTSSPSLS